MLGGLKNITFLISVEHTVIFKEGVMFTRNSIHLNFLEYFYEKKKKKGLETQLLREKTPVSESCVIDGVGESQW